MYDNIHACEWVTKRFYECMRLCEYARACVCVCVCVFVDMLCVSLYAYICVRMGEHAFLSVYVFSCIVSLCMFTFGFCVWGAFVGAWAIMYVVIRAH